MIHVLAGEAFIQLVTHSHFQTDAPETDFSGSLSPADTNCAALCLWSISYGLLLPFCEVQELAESGHKSLRWWYAWCPYARCPYAHVQSSTKLTHFDTSLTSASQLAVPGATASQERLRSTFPLQSACHWSVFGRRPKQAKVLLLTNTRSFKLKWEKNSLNIWKIKGPTVYAYMNIYTHTIMLPLTNRCYHCKAFVTVTSLRRSMSYFIAHPFCQSATAYNEGAAPSSAEEMPIEPGLCTTHTLCTSCQPWAFLW